MSRQRAARDPVNTYFFNFLSISQNDIQKSKAFRRLRLGNITSLAFISQQQKTRSMVVSGSETRCHTYFSSQIRQK